MSVAAQPDRRGPAGSRGAPSRFLTAVTIGTALLLLVGAAIALVAPNLLTGTASPGGEADRVYEDYTVARDGALGLFLVALLALREVRTLAAALALIAAVQLIDGVLDVAGGRWLVLPAVVSVGVAGALAASRGLRQCARASTDS